MKCSDYIVSFLLHNKITDVFGYPGGMVTHLMDSLHSRACDGIRTHISYHEQAAAFEACGWAQTTRKPGVCFATSGPGATNLLTGIGNAFYDSIPMLCITGQVNTYESKGGLSVRQKGFQETDIVAICRPITKYCVQVTDAHTLPMHLQRAYTIALEGRPGPVLLDIPMNIFRADITPDEIPKGKGAAHLTADKRATEEAAKDIAARLSAAQRPVIIAGAGIRASGAYGAFHSFCVATGIPVVTSMPAVDLLPGESTNYGFIGAYGHRAANFIVSKSDCILSLGSRLDVRQTGSDPAAFAPEALLLRVDIDPGELTNRIKKREHQYIASLPELLPQLEHWWEKNATIFSPWRDTCDEIRFRLAGMDREPGNLVMETVSKMIPADAVVTTDVGQNQAWAAQSFVFSGQRMLFSSGHGAMGYSLPAAIGAQLASKKPVYCFTGDGGLQMNLQEIEFIRRERLPVKILVLNNHSLGMIRHFQEMYFNSCYAYTIPENGYTSPSFTALAAAYGIPAIQVEAAALEPIRSFMNSPEPALMEIIMPRNTYVFPKSSVNALPQDQDPLLDRNLFEYLSNL